MELELGRGVGEAPFRLDLAAALAAAAVAAAAAVDAAACARVAAVAFL